MELAIEQMKLSIDEPRSDGKVSPKVGAVLVNVADEAPGYGRILTACRGELRGGDHAEFTLLERKNRDRALDDFVLLATLSTIGSTGSKEYAERLEIDRRTAARHLARFEEFGLVRKVGAGSATRYEVK